MNRPSYLRYSLAATASLSALITGVVAFIGGWQRRWIADDGLIVLRTVRNILAGNGPVFNAGERVEANTSTVWQYMIAAVGAVSNAKLESIALWLALLCTTAALVIVCLGTARLYRTSMAVLPLGGLVYIALPPARDFATSGLEWGPSLLWLAVAWALLVGWAQPAEGSQRRSRHRVHRPSFGGPRVYVLAFWAGLSWLVRPELALYGGLIGLVLLIGAGSWKVAAGILAAAVPVPAAYELFRMGYYGLLTPQTAVAKSASGAEWSLGWNYVQNLADPYLLWLGLAVCLAAAAGAMWAFASTGTGAVPGWPRARKPGVAVAVFLIGALIHIVYVIRVGGDFMHGRMLLLPLFALLAPVSVIPLADVIRVRVVPAAVMGVLAACGWSWAVSAAVHGSTPHTDADPGSFHVVDEREFWTYNTGRAPGEPPRELADYYTASAMGNFPDAMETARRSRAAMLMGTSVGGQVDQMLWLPLSSDATLGAQRQPLTVYPTVMGMLGMEAPLNMRVNDTVGLSTPLAARQPRLEGARIGHDKALPVPWQIADTAADIDSLPAVVDKKQVAAARAALHTPDFVELYRVYREPMSWKRFWSNVGFALTKSGSLEFSRNPEDYAMDVAHNSDPTAQISWPVEAKLDNPR